MTSPFETVTDLLQANARLTLSLAEISRASGQAYVRLGGQAVSQFADHAQHLASGEGLSRSDEASSLLADLQRDQQATADKAAAAWTDWRKAWVQAWAQAVDQKAATEAFQALLQPLSALAPDAAKSAARSGRAKAAD